MKNSGLHGFFVKIKMGIGYLTFDNYLTFTAVLVIAVVAVRIFLKEDKDVWRKNAPSIITTIGIFCTFLGVTIGLYRFNPDDSDSLHFLLAGLKLAFLPSAFAILIAIIFKWSHSSQHSNSMLVEFIQKTQDNTDAIKKLSDAISVLDWQVEYKERLEINIDRNTELLAILENSLSKMLQYLSEEPKKLEKSIDDMVSSVKNVTEILRNININLDSEINKLVQGFSNNMSQNYTKSQNDIQSLYQEIGKLKLTVGQLTSETTPVVSQIKGSLNEISLNIEKNLSQKLNNILSKM